MKNSILNYHFFKSYRIPIRDSDKITIDLSIEDSTKQYVDLRLESINLTGLNFKSSNQFVIGSKVNITLNSKSFLHPWCFDLKGKIVRSFISEEDTSLVVYGILLDKNLNSEVLDYFLKDYIKRLTPKVIEEHLFLASTLNRKIHLSEGVELFSLFYSIIEDIFTSDPKDLLKDLSSAFKSNYYSIHIHNLNSNVLEHSRSNIEKIDYLSSSQKNIELSFANNTLVNFNKNKEARDISDDKKTEIYNSISYPIHNRLQKPIGVVTIYNTLDKKHYNSLQETSLKLFCTIMSYFFKDYNSKLKNCAEVETVYDNFIGHNRTNIELKNVIDNLKNQKKNIIVTGEQGTKKHEIIDYIIENSRYNTSDYTVIDFSSLDKISEFFAHTEDLNSQTKVFHLKEVYKLNHSQQSYLYDFLKNSKAIVYTESSIELSYHVKTGKILKKLFYFLAHVQIYLPPLRNRKNDILDIASEILKEELDKRELPFKEFTHQSIDALIEYSWPQNLKELRTEIRKGILRSYNDMKISLHLKTNKKDTVAQKNKSLFKLIHSAIELHDTSINYENHVEIIKEHFEKKDKTQAS